MNIYFKVVEVQIQALDCIPKLGRDSRTIRNNFDSRTLLPFREHHFLAQVGVGATRPSFKKRHKNIYSYSWSQLNRSDYQLRN
jgi:hypothetical protein